jgi:TolB-like protein
MSALASGAALARASDVGASLGVDYLVEGSVRRHGSHARITVALVKAREELQAWGEIYDREVAEPVRAQVEVASSIAWSIIEAMRTS